MGVDEIRQYLSHLATDGNVAASTQNVERAKRPKRVPVVFTPEEAS